MAPNKNGGDGDYEVGYGKPPKRTQFKPGQSGNRSGRPKGRKNLKTDLLEELNEQVRLREGDRDIKISKQRALVKSMVARGVKGNDRATAKVIDLYLRVVGLEEAAAGVDVPLTPDERSVLDTLRARLLRDLGKHTGCEEDSVP